MRITLAPVVQPKASRLFLDLTGLTAEDIQNTITDWTEEKNISEWTVFAFDDEFEPVAESTDPVVWAAWVEAFEEHGYAILKFWDDVLGFTYCKDVDEVLESFQSAYQGEFADKEEWARDYIASFYRLEGPLEEYFDYEKYVRDCEIGGDMTFIDADNGNVFAFNRNF